MPALLLKVKHLGFPDNVNGVAFFHPGSPCHVICQWYTLWVCVGGFLYFCGHNSAHVTEFMFVVLESLFTCWPGWG